VVSREGIVVQLYAGETILRIRLHEMEDFEKNRRNELNEKRLFSVHSGMLSVNEG
jgi:hypothetical protein